MAIANEEFVQGQLSDLSGIIWITGFSAAGKTTLGRKVVARLRAEGIPTIFLDGDDLRSIFGSNWGYDRPSRIELARVYFRFCSHLASQGITVVICAVAMFSEVREWVRSNIPRSIQVYLRVPEAERRRRDAETKQIYDEKTDFHTTYDEPTSPELVIDNYGGADPDLEADRIIQRFRLEPSIHRDMGRYLHWNTFYSSAIAPQKPSSFAVSVASCLSQSVKLLEVGCGNGRDSAFFARQSHAVTALDISDAAIRQCQKNHGDLGIHFFAGKITDLPASIRHGYTIVYSRFVFHAMTLEEEMETIEAAFNALHANGEFRIECRSINDPLARMGEVISPTERIHGHYRRFIILDELVERLERVGFRILSLVESNGLAVFGEEDPVVIRVAAQRP